MPFNYTWQDEPVASDDALNYAESLDTLSEEVFALDLRLARAEADVEDNRHIALTNAQRLMLGLNVSDW